MGCWHDIPEDVSELTYWTSASKVWLVVLSCYNTSPCGADSVSSRVLVIAFGYLFCKARKANLLLCKVARQNPIWTSAFLHEEKGLKAEEIDRHLPAATSDTERHCGGIQTGSLRGTRVGKIHSGFRKTKERWIMLQREASILCGSSAIVLVVDWGDVTLGHWTSCCVRSERAFEAALQLQTLCRSED